GTWSAYRGRARSALVAWDAARLAIPAFDPNVWSGRASQEVFVETDERSCINVSGLWLELVRLPAIMDISARAISLADRPQRAIWVASARRRREDRLSISSLSSRRPRQVRSLGYVMVCRPRALGDHAERTVASSIGVASKLRPRARTLHAMRASLLASATARTLRCSRFLAASSQGLSP